MRVFIVTKEPFPNGLAAVNRIKCLAKALISQRVVCKVIIFGRHNGQENVPYRGTTEGITYEYVGHSTTRVKGKILGRLQSFLLTVRFLALMLFKLRSNDFVYSYIVGNCVIRNYLIRIVHVKKAFFISELCELPYGTGRETNKTLKLRQYEYKQLMPQYDGVVAISDALVSLAREYCNRKCVIIKVPILVDFEKYDIPNLSFLSDIPYIFHSGTLYEQKDGILGMIEAFGMAIKRSSKQIHFVLTGDLETSPHSSEIRALISKYSLWDIIHFVGYLSHMELKDRLSKASMVIINKYETQQNKYCFSTKMGEYMAAGKPLIITRVGEAMNWVTDSENCIIVEPGNKEQLADAILEIFCGKIDTEKMGHSAKELCLKSFDFHQHSEKIIDMLCHIQGEIVK